MCNWSPLLHLRLRTKFILQHHLLPAVNTMEIQQQKRQENKDKVVDSTIQFRVLRSSRVSKRGIKRDARGCATTSGPDNLDTVKQKSYWTLSLHGNEAIATATKHLMEADAKLKAVIEWHDQGPQFEQCTSCFSALARSIVYQQLAPKAAHSINTRLVTLCEKKHAEGVTPAVVASLSASQMREIGISGRKASYLHDLANHFVTGALSDDIIQQMDEETLMAALTAVKGIGVWSVHMFMIFWLHKSDVLPVGDLGVRKGFQKLYHLEALPSVSQMTEIAASWRPFRSLGAWYLWRLNDNSRPFPPLA
ncbi:unnamed protein product [Sphagnum troendelagicum]|uniref:HhH-GPD domain-containing protein n=1 Tax=Sphagnum troendelagicum TaxID=128251 RepID=A0ABP0UI21_9BRYO